MIKNYGDGGHSAVLCTLPFGSLNRGYVAPLSATPKFRLTANLHISPERYMKWRPLEIYGGTENGKKNAKK